MPCEDLFISKILKRSKTTKSLCAISTVRSCANKLSATVPL